MTSTATCPNNCVEDVVMAYIRFFGLTGLPQILSAFSAATWRIVVHGGGFPTILSFEYREFLAGKYGHKNYMCPMPSACIGPYVRDFETPKMGVVLSEHHNSVVSGSWHPTMTTTRFFRLTGLPKIYVGLFQPLRGASLFTVVIFLPDFHSSVVNFWRENVDTNGSILDCAS